GRGVAQPVAVYIYELLPGLSQAARDREATRPAFHAVVVADAGVDVLRLAVVDDRRTPGLRRREAVAQVERHAYRPAVVEHPVGQPVAVHVDVLGLDAAVALPEATGQPET